VAGVAMPTYVDGIRSAWYVSFMSCPVIIVLAGFGANGLPVNAQIAATRRPDFT
jgi:amidase